MTERAIKDLKVYQDSDQVVNGAGKIVRQIDYWCVEYTASLPGHVDVDYCPVFVTEEAARSHAWRLLAEEFAGAAAGLGSTDG